MHRAAIGSDPQSLVLVMPGPGCGADRLPGPRSDDLGKEVEVFDEAVDGRRVTACRRNA